MNETQQRIREDLVDEIEGDVRTDDVTLGLYATDASLYEVRPQAVVWPRGEDDIIKLLKYASEMNVSVIPRGGGTGVAGGCLGQGIIVDCSRTMRRVLDVTGQTVRVEPGVNRNQLNRSLREHGVYFTPDPANSETTTVGSMLAVNAGGSHSIRFGATRDHVQSLRVALPDGTVIDTTSDKRPTDHEEGFRRADMLEHQLTELATRHSDLIAARQSEHIGESSGYFLRTLAEGASSRLNDLLVGSEGTLGLFTEATLHVTPLAPARGAMMALFPSTDDAIEVVLRIGDEQPAACDLLDRRLLTLARDQSLHWDEAIPASAEAALLIDFFGQSRREITRRLDRVETLVRDICPHVVFGSRAETHEDVDALWQLPQAVTSLLAKLPGAARPLPFVEDIVVPPTRWDEFLPRARKVLQRHEVTASLYAHALAGKIHLRPFLPLPTTPADSSRIESIARDLYAAVFDSGGTMSSEHGDGFSRTAFLRSRYGPLYPVFRDVKRLFDPGGVMNPDKIVSDDQRVTVRNLRIPAQVVDVPLQLRWPGESFTAEINACNGCGSCRSHDEHSRMCPVFRLTDDEQASPRAKANILRSLLDGTMPDGVTATEVIQSADMRTLNQTCFNCKQCRIDCPSRVDIPRLVIESKATYVAANGLRGADWILSRAHSFGRLGCALSPIANWALGNAATRWLIEKSIGIARKRKLPKFARRPFVTTLRHEVQKPDQPPTTPRDVVYFVDHFANYHDVELAAATVMVLRHNGWTVHVPATQDASGMAMVSAGDLDGARELAEHNVRILARYVEQGMPVVSAEPAAVLCIREEYPRLIDDPDVSLVAGAVTGVGELLAEQHHRGELKTDFAPLPVTVLQHTPCHVKALHRGQPLTELLTLIPELTVVPIEKGCSGMAGAYGLTREHFKASITIGRELLETMRTTNADGGTTSCSSCRMQMEQRTGKPTLHPIKFLAASYGLLPNFSKRLQKNKSSLTIS